jgi:Flp pilus assembly protein TadG
VVPVLMLVLLVVVQFALWAHAAQVVQLAASEGDRTARTLGGSTALGAAQARSVLAAQGSDVTTSSVAVTMQPGGVVSVSVSGRAVSILPGLTLPVDATQTGALQEFRPSE